VTNAVCVLGMMRTGTSAVAGILARLGVDFGPAERMLAPNVANPDGFWEHTGVISLNDELLARLGGSWHAPPDMPVGWQNDAALNDLRTRATDLVAADLATAEVWGWKDPRSCLTLPFWHTVVPSPAHVLCLREPGATARSLAGIPWANRRFDHPQRAGLDLWARYTSDALAHSEGHRRLLVLYDELVDTPHAETARLAAFADLSERLTPDVEQDVEAFLRPSLRHHVDEGAKSATHPAFALYERLRETRDLHASGGHLQRKTGVD
jgi:hypothetical protein